MILLKNILKEEIENPQKSFQLPKVRKFGIRLIKEFQHLKNKIQRWNVYERDNENVVYQFYFSLLDGRDIIQIVRINQKYKGILKFYSEKQLICVDMKLNIGNIV